MKGFCLVKKWMYQKIKRPNRVPDAVVNDFITEGDDTDVCPGCLEPIASLRGMLLRPYECPHQVCAACFSQCAKQGRTLACPLCRAEATPQAEFCARTIRRPPPPPSPPTRFFATTEEVELPYRTPTRRLSFSSPEQEEVELPYRTPRRRRSRPSPAERMAELRRLELEEERSYLEGLRARGGVEAPTGPEDEEEI